MHEKNLQLTYWQLYINNIEGFLGVGIFYLQGDNIISDTLSYIVKLFLQVNYLQISTSFNKNLIFKP